LRTYKEIRYIKPSNEYHEQFYYLNHIREFFMSIAGWVGLNSAEFATLDKNPGKLCIDVVSMLPQRHGK